jgi:hypothetical protein
MTPMNSLRMIWRVFVYVVAITNLIIALLLIPFEFFPFHFRDLMGNFGDCIVSVYLLWSLQTTKRKK